MQADQELDYSSPDWRKTLESVNPIKDNKRKLALEPYPADKVLVDFAELVYSDCSGEKPEGWYLLTTAQNNNNGYFGCAVWNPSQQQIAIAHRGTRLNNLGAIWIDGKSIYCNKYTEHMYSAVSFADEIKKVIIEINEGCGIRFVLSFTGHSLGAWLAGVTTLTVKHLKREGGRFSRVASPDEGLHAHTLALDSPGVEDILMKICRVYDFRCNGSMVIRNLDITTILGAANAVNCTGFHVGGVRQIHIKRVSLPSDSEEPNFMCNIDTHGIDNFTDAYKDGNDTSIYVVETWPQGLAERKYHHKQEIYSNSYVLRPDAEEEHVPDPFEGSSRLEDTEEMPASPSRITGQSEQHHHGLEIFLNDESTGTFEEYAGRLSFIDRLKKLVKMLVPEDEDEDDTLSHYRSELSLGNSCKLGFFSFIELEFLKNWKLFQSNSIINLTEIDKFLFGHNLETLDFPKFELDFGSYFITCDSGEHEGRQELEKVIRQTKQLIRWFPKIMNALKEQNRSIKAAPFYVAGRAYLRSLPYIVECEDTLGLETFLESSEQRVLQIQTSDFDQVKFEAARLHNILKEKDKKETCIKKETFKKIYVKGRCRTFLSWTDMAGMAKNVNIKSLSKTDITNDNLLVLCFETPTEIKELNYDLLGRILRNLEKCSHKKLVIILPELIFSDNIFMKYNLTVETKPLKVFGLNDLTVTSRKKIFERDLLIIGEKTLSLNMLLGDDCKSPDETVRSKITELIAPILKTLATDKLYTINIPNKLPRHCELDALYSKGNKRVDKSKLEVLLKRNGVDGPLIVISDPGGLSQEYWGDIPDTAQGRIFTTTTESRDMFQEKCREEPERIIYWFSLSDKGLTLCEVYSKNIYLPRKFHGRFIIKSINEFVQYRGSEDLFIFNGGKDKTSLIRRFDLSKEAENLFIKNDHFKMRIPSHKLKRDDKIKGDLLNKHFFRLLNLRGSPCLMWKYSKGSVDGLRPFITRDDKDTISEGDFSNTKKKLIIIADDPGMGKTTSLTCLSELIQNAWVLRIYHKHLDSATANLPPKLDLKSVIDCLIHISGIPRDTNMVHCLLRYCLESDNARKVCVFLDAFDQITEEKTKIKMVELLKYLKTDTNCQTVVTTRVYRQESLEKDLEEFSAEFEKITGEEQENYMVNSWLPHLTLEFPEHGEADEARLRQFAKELRLEMEGVLGEDVANFMGIPLQISMIREVFLHQAITYVISSEQVKNSCKITNLFDLYKQFIEVKKNIFFEKASVNKLAASYQNNLFANILDQHYCLALRIHDSTFASRQYPTLTNQDLKDMSTVGLIRSKTDGTFPFIHFTFQEYFCADFFVKWFRQKKNSKEENMLILKELSKFLLRPNYKIVRMFIETQLEISPIPDNALENHPTIYQHWNQLFFHDHDKTPLHIAVEEQNTRIVEVLLSGPTSRTSEEAYISFISARDKAGRTAQDIAIENRNSNILSQINVIKGISINVSHL